MPNRPEKKTKEQKELEEQEAMDKAMERLQQLENEIGYTFNAFIHHHPAGSQTFIAPVKKKVIEVEQKTEE